MAEIDKWFTFATAGETVDGRVIEENMLREMAERYSMDYYTAVIDADHELEWYGSFGHVTQVRLGEKLGRVSLEGKINANQRLMEMNRNNQRMWFSIWPREIEGSNYLFRLAITDNPASIGTDYLRFCSQPGGQRPAFTTPKPLELPAADLDDDQQEQPPHWFKNFLKTFTGTKPTPEPEQEDDTMTPEQLNQITDAIKAQGEQFASALEALKPEPETEPATPAGEPASAEPQQPFSAADVMAELKKVAEQNTAIQQQFATLANMPAGTTNVPAQTGGADDQNPRDVY